MTTRRRFIGSALAAALAPHALRGQLRQFETPAVDTVGSWTFRPDPSLPNVLILGDSISIGYTRDVRTLLSSKANVDRPMSSKDSPVNCGDTEMGIAGIHRWLKGPSWSVVHFNWGLWDLCYRDPKSTTQGHRDKVNGKLTSTIPQYAANLRTILSALEETRASLVWASTTVVPPNEAGRNVGDEVKYNAAAAGLMAEHHIPVDDLYALTATFKPEDFQEPGNVHFQANAYMRIARQVASSILPHLPQARA